MKANEDRGEIREPRAGPVALTRGAPLPLYFQLREELLNEIRERGLRPGDRLPTEAALERRYGVSATTIRRALNDLAAEGLVRRIQGKGTFVGTPKIHQETLLRSFTELLLSQGYTPEHRLLESSIEPAPMDVAEDLDIQVGASCRRLRRLHLADNNPIGVSDTWIPRDILGPHDALLERGLETGSLYSLLENPPVGINLHRAIETISPSLASEADAQLLGCALGDAVLAIKRITFDVNDRAIESARIAFAGERYEYRVEMYRPSPVSVGHHPRAWGSPRTRGAEAGPSETASPEDTRASPR